MLGAKTMAIQLGRKPRHQAVANPRDDGLAAGGLGQAQAGDQSGPFAAGADGLEAAAESLIDPVEKQGWEAPREGGPPGPEDEGVEVADTPQPKPVKPFDNGPVKAQGGNA